MPPKRKATAPPARASASASITEEVTVTTTTIMTKKTASGSTKRAAEDEDFSEEPAAKKAKKTAAATATAKDTDKGKKEKVKIDWKDVQLEEGDDGVPVYDDCNEVRRKIRLLQKTPGFKVTHWLKEIGNINNNSYGRFMSAKGPTGGAGNGTYYAAYVYFEKVRIAEGKKKTAKRISNESDHSFGFSLQEPRGMWIMGR